MSVNDELVEMFAGLLEDSHLTTIEQLPTTVWRRAERAGFHHVVIYVVDLQQEVLRPLVRDGDREEGDPESSEAALPVDERSILVMRGAGPIGHPSGLWPGPKYSKARILRNSTAFYEKE